MTILRSVKVFDCPACKQKTWHEIRTVEGVTISVKICGHCTYRTYEPVKLKKVRKAAA